MINLIQNSIKFSREGDKITVTVMRRMTPDQQYNFQICVADEGMGVPEEDRQNLFKPFFQTKNKKSK